MNALRTAMVVFRNELRIERAGREISSSSFFLAMLLMVISVLGFYSDRLAAPLVAPGALWISMAFAIMMAVSRSWQREREGGVMDAILVSPTSLAAFFYGKALASLAILSGILVVLVCLAAMFFHLPFDMHFVWLCGLLWLGMLGFVFAAMLFSALVALSEIRDLALTLVVFPLTTPAILAGVVATREVYLNAGAPMGWLRILLAFDLLFVVAPALLFEKMARE